MRERLASGGPPTAATLRAAKQAGFSDSQIADICGIAEERVRRWRHDLGVRPVYHTVDTCAAEFEARTPYLYSTYDEASEVPAGDRPKVIILGSGPNRIGQGIEFDYACVHACFALSAAGYETVMVNCNPETGLDRLRHLGPAVLRAADARRTCSRWCDAEQAAGPVAGRDRAAGRADPARAGAGARRRGRPGGGHQPGGDPPRRGPRRVRRAAGRGRAARAPARDARPRRRRQAVAAEIGYPVLVRPSYVLGGRGMEIVYDDDTLAVLRRPWPPRPARSTRS